MEWVRARHVHVNTIPRPCRLDLRVEDVEFTAHLVARIRYDTSLSTERDPVGVVHVRLHLRRFLYQIAAFLGGPWIRRYTKREINRQTERLAASIAAMPGIEVPYHRSSKWEFIADPMAPPTNAFDPIPARSRRRR